MDVLVVELVLWRARDVVREEETVETVVEDGEREIVEAMTVMVKVEVEKVGVLVGREHRGDGIGGAIFAGLSSVEKKKILWSQLLTRGRAKSSSFNDGGGTSIP